MGRRAQPARDRCFLHGTECLFREIALRRARFVPVGDVLHKRMEEDLNSRCSSTALFNSEQRLRNEAQLGGEALSVIISNACGTR